MKILLINPEAPMNRPDFKGFLGEPLGLLYIASALEQQGHIVRVLDLQTTSQFELKRALVDLQPEVVGITSMTSNFEKACKVAKAVKDACSPFVLLGGVHATFASQDLSNHSEFDAYVLGEGEYTAIELADSIGNGNGLSNIKGLAYRDRSQVFFTKPRPVEMNLDAIPFPARHLIDMDYYIAHKGSAQVITTRGCPYSCIFCSTSKLHGNRYRVRSTTNVVSELQLILEKYSSSSISFADDNFTFNKLRVRRFCEEILGKNMDFSWSCSARVDNIDEQMLQLMKRSGCKEIFFGIESGSQKILDSINKGFSLHQAEVAVKLAKKFGIKTTASFILGLPGETRETLRETANFAEKMAADSCIFSFITPFPGTYLNDNLEELGYKVVDSDLSHYNCHYPTMELSNLGIADLQSAWLDAALRFSKKVETSG